VTAEALPVRVDSGVELSGLSFAMVPTKTATISGVVRLADGSVPTGFSVSWSQSDGRALTRERASR
jgi:hypothetical protein